MPNAFHRHARALGLDLADIGLIDALETRRTDADEAVTVSFPRLAKEINTSAETIRRRVDGLVARGLLEKRRRHRDDGSNMSCAITRHGLTKALQLIDGNLVAGRQATDGLSDLLAGLARPHPQIAGAPTNRSEVPHPHTDAASQEPVVQEPEEQEPLRGAIEDRVSFDIGPTTADDLVGRLVQLFDATEERVSDVCAYPHHGPSDWQSHQGNWQCGVCHPPAAEHLVARRRVEAA